MARWLTLLGLVIVVAVVKSRSDRQPIPASPAPRTVAPPPVAETAEEPTRASGIWNPDDDSGLESEPDPKPPATSKPDLEASESVGYYWLEDASGFRSGIEMAVAKSKPIAVYFQTDWCGYCREFEDDLLTRARVEAFTKYLVKVRINPESGHEERQLARQFGVRGYPSFFVQASAKAKPVKIRQHKRVRGRWVLQSPEEFVDTLRRAVR